MSSSPDSKTRLMQAAVTLVGELGYKAASTKKIAQAAEMNEATIFRLFGSKKQLVQDAIYFHSMGGADLDLSRVWECADFRGRLEEFIRQFLELSIRQLTVNRALMVCPFDASEIPFQQAYCAKLQQVADQFEAFLGREEALGEVRKEEDCILPDMVFSRLSMAAMYFYRWDSEDECVEAKQAFVRQLTEMLYGKLSASRAG